MLQRRVRFQPAFDKRHPDPSQDYGIHGVDIHMELIGPGAGVVFVLFTNWHLPHVTKAMLAQPPLNATDIAVCFQPMTAGVRLHRLTVFPGSGPSSVPCDVLGLERCHGAISYQRDDEIFAALVAEGDEGVWRILEECHAELVQSPVG